MVQVHELGFYSIRDFDLLKYLLYEASHTHETGT